MNNEQFVMIAQSSRERKVENNCSLKQGDSLSTNNRSSSNTRILFIGCRDCPINSEEEGKKNHSVDPKTGNPSTQECVNQQWQLPGQLQRGGQQWLVFETNATQYLSENRPRGWIKSNSLRRRSSRREDCCWSSVGKHVLKISCAFMRYARGKDP